MADTVNMTQERAANRFHQIASLERELVAKLREVADAQAELKEQKEQADALIRRLRQAARDEGELPLFGMFD
jgi:predicted RNase H-like nuclease (RuvC/YqgF family)